MVTFDEVTTGAENDLKQATSMARRMVGLWGMSEEVGPVYLGTGEEHVFLGREITQERAFSDATATRLDQAVRDIIEVALQQAISLVTTNKTKLEALVAALMEHETLDATQVTEIFGPRPVPGNDPLAGATPQPVPAV
jgi:cell division protease FtsH